MSWFGIVPLNKPPGVTSRWAVDRVKRLVRPDKVGHAGTLDPLARGVLLVPLGPATRLVSYLHELPKSYTAEFRLGCASPSEDTEAEVTELPDAPIPTSHELAQAAQRLRGTIWQRPSSYSAVKVGGRPAYRLARAGRPVELAAKAVTIHALSVVAYEYPRLVLELECSSGTYVRALGRDLAESLGTAAVMTALVRTSIGPFGLERCVDPGELTAESLRHALADPLWAVERLPRLVLDETELARVAHGLAIDRTLPVEASQVAAVDASGRLRALLGPRGTGLGPVLNFPVAG